MTSVVEDFDAINRHKLAIRLREDLTRAGPVKDDGSHEMLDPYSDAAKPIREALGLSSGSDAKKLLDDTAALIGAPRSGTGTEFWVEELRQKFWAVFELP